MLVGAEVFNLNSVSVVRNGNPILRDVNWKVEPGENWVLLGPNGVGKSTLINIISSRSFPTSGAVSILGETLGKVDVFELRKRIGVLGADIGDSFPASLTAREVVVTAKYAMTDIWGDARDSKIRPEDLQQAEELLELFGADRLVDRAWGVLSQGERKRVQMARTLINDPELLLFDEPTAGLDLAGREQVIATLTKLSSFNRDSGSKRAIVLVNHNVEEIPPSFDKIAIMGSTSDPTDARLAPPVILREAKRSRRVHQPSAPAELGSSSAGTILFQGPIPQNLTSEKLTEAYGISLTVSRTPNLRYFASASVIVEK